MTDKPIIHASLVDARNVASTKDIKLDVRIPAEMATRFLEVFGWPTPVSPVSVVIVPLSKDATGGVPAVPAGPVSDDAFKRIETEEPRQREQFTKLPRVKQAGIRCNDAMFWGYLNDRFGGDIQYPGLLPINDAERAAAAVRWWCNVSSRRDLDHGRGAAATLWDALEADFYAKSHGMH